MDLSTLKNRYAAGVNLLQQEGIYPQVIEEVALLVKYFDGNYFYHLLTENILDDIKGTFRSFILKELPAVYEQLRANPTQPLEPFFQREFNSLTILKSCTLNVRYQVSGLMRFSQTRNLLFKSTYLQGIHRKLNGKIQEYYRQLSEHYKQYFRNQFVHRSIHPSRVSIQCLEDLAEELDNHFVMPLRKFEALQQAVAFIHGFLLLQLRGTVQERMTYIFQHNGKRVERLVTYFIQDIKCDFIRMLDRQLRKGKPFSWIQRGLLMFLESNRFESLLRSVIYQSLVVHPPRHNRVKKSAS